MVTKMLERAIEIEGLLRIIRDGKPFPETYSLLKEKTAQLAEQVKSLEEKSENVEQPKPAVLETPEKPAIEDLDLSEEDDIVLTFEEGAEPESNEDVVIDIVQEIKIDGNQEIETDNNQEIELDGNREIEIAGNQEEATDSVKKEEATPKKSNAPKSGIKLKSCFSLNDRFLYARELFDGNMKMFDSTLDFIEGIEDFSIIEDYFYNEMEWDHDNSAVQSFMERLRPHFND